MPEKETKQALDIVSKILFEVRNFYFYIFRASIRNKVIQELINVLFGLSVLKQVSSTSRISRW